MRREPKQPSSLGARLEHEVQMSVLEIANAAVNQARRSTRGSAGEVVLLDERHAKSAQRGVARDAASGDARRRSPAGRTVARRARRSRCGAKASADVIPRMNSKSTVAPSPSLTRPPPLASFKHGNSRHAGRRVAIVAGVRTPFARAGTAFKDLTAIELGKRCVAELIQRTNLDGDLVEAIVYGTVVPSVLAPNIAREVSLHADPAARLPGVHRESRVRVGESGDHRRRRPDRARSSRRRHRRRRRVALERADPALAQHVREARRDVARARARRSACASRAPFVRAISFRSRRRSPSRRPARRWGSRPRRWRRSITSRARSRISSRCGRIDWPRLARRTDASPRRSFRCTCRRATRPR